MNSMRAAGDSSSSNTGPPAGLLRADAYPHPVQNIIVIETHISWVFLTGDFAYKVKRPVDFTTLERRKHFCHEEVRLNRRTAPDLYLDVVPIAGTPDAAVIEGDGETFEYAVKMRQFDRRQSLDCLVDQHRVTTAELADFARRLARFHLKLAPCPNELTHGGPEVVAGAVRQNFEQIDAYRRGAPPAPQLERLKSWSETKLTGLREKISRRKTGGWVRECHGDLHSGNIVRLGQKLVAFDCLEFNPDFRWLDVISEVSFLGMDLAVRGREDLAYTVFNRYLETALDYAGAALIDFYRVYFCLVRAKVEVLTKVSRADAHPIKVAHPDIADYLGLASRLAFDREPLLFFTHGLSGSGKTWVTDQLMTSLPAIRIRADVIRKHLHGLGADQDSHSDVATGIYSEAANHRTYERLAALAKDLLGAGVHVIIDAACLMRWQRRLLVDAATEMGVPWQVIACRAEDAVLRERIRARHAAGRDASEADLAVLDHQIQNQEPLTDRERCHILQRS